MSKIISSLSEFNSADVFFEIKDLVQVPVFLKAEGINLAGSIKLKPAQRIIRELEKNNKINHDTKIIESSSGNFGIALSLIAAERGYKFICVTDPNSSQDSIAFMKALGAEVIVVSERDANGGFLGTRIKLIEEMCEGDPNLIWLNQYANHNNFLAHYETTAAEILQQFKKVDYLFVGVGTSGTFTGCSLHFQKYSPETKIIAVDAEGSVTFGYEAKKRVIPGLGTSRKPEILDQAPLCEHLIISEPDTIRMCHKMARRGLLCGGSTGTVLAAISQYAKNIAPESTVVAISPDLGHKYLHTIYNQEWLAKNFSEYQFNF